MAVGAWGTKIGMTQLFNGDKVVPVTAIEVSRWLVIDVRTDERDGYSAVQVGRMRSRYTGDQYSSDWLKQKKKYFGVVREIKVDSDPEESLIGTPFAFESALSEGDAVDVFGKTRGRGFAGVVRRHNFAGAPASHGATMGKRTGSLSFMCSQGRVVKGKKMPGQMGNVARVAQNLAVVKMEQDAGVVLVKGSVPGHAGSLVFIRKRT